MKRDPSPPPAGPRQRSRTAQRAHLAVLAVLQVVMAVQLVLLAMRGDVPQAVFVGGIMAVTLAPALSRHGLSVEIPSEIEVVAVLFIFATLFLGEVRDYYQRYWWWDMALHTTSGLLLGMLGFMIVYVLNEDRHVDLHMRPAFVALFAFFFAVGLGALWEIFEFGMDRVFGTDMQPATPGDPSGLTDTIHDLIVDTVGALVVSLFGWRYIARPEPRTSTIGPSASSSATRSCSATRDDAQRPLRPLLTLEAARAPARPPPARAIRPTTNA